jgi:DNA-binding transcriptional MerR regulator
VIQHVLLIKQAQELGFSLGEIKGLLATGGPRNVAAFAICYKRRLPMWIRG